MNCIKCGNRATKRIGFDLVEPDSGIPVCDECAEAVKVELCIALDKDKELE